MHITGKVIIVVFALVSLFGGVFLVVQKKLGAEVVEQAMQKEVRKENEVKTIPVSIDEIDTLNWKTYRSKDYGFEFRMPRTFTSKNEDVPNKNNDYYIVYDQPPFSNYSSVDDTGHLITEKMEEGVYFFIGKIGNLNDRILDSIPYPDLYSPLWSPFVSSGNIDVKTEKIQQNGINMIVIRSIYLKPPLSDNPDFRLLYEFGEWLEGIYAEEAFFQCGKNICSVQINSHTYSQEKHEFFRTILTTVKPIE